MIVTIDGPAGAGKSSVAKLLARRLGFRFLDTGAMYRAVTLAAFQHHINWDDPQQLADLAKGLAIEVQDGRVWLDRKEITHEIRTPEITKLVRHAADNPEVRSFLVQLQRQEAKNGNIVSEGRDQGTVVFPDAECKFFLTASDRERAKRRYEDLLAQGETTTLDEVLAQQQRRDAQDSSRAVGALKRAPDAMEVITDGMNLENVVDQLAKLVTHKIKYLAED